MNELYNEWMKEMEWTGMEMKWNGMEWNGMEWNDWLTDWMN